MKKNNLLLLLAAGGAALFLYQRKVKADERAAALLQAHIAQAKANIAAQRKANTAVISEGGTIVPPPLASMPKSTKFGPQMAPPDMGW